MPHCCCEIALELEDDSDELELVDEELLDVDSELDEDEEDVLSEELLELLEEDERD
ncbi:unnamed protein product [marine sediment metagenome]|uniref:Uncharacterized protein n=1 Tax=marine sediment metagenome TaxID=412755 RepID=X1U0N4_9ZZZZ